MSQVRIAESFLATTTVSGSLVAWLDLIEGVSKVGAAVCAFVAGIFWVITRYYAMREMRRRALHPQRPADPDEAGAADDPQPP